MRRIYATALSAVFVLASSNALAATTTFEKEGDWNTASNWDNGIPTANDTVIIAENCTLDTSNGVADNITVNANVVLTITGVRLELDGSVSSTHTINGDIVLSNSTAELRFIDRDQTIAGSGQIEGQNSDARLEDDNPLTPRKLTLNSTATFAGGMQILLSVQNDGTIDADDSTAVMLLDGDATFNGTGDYNVSVNGGVMRFADGASFDIEDLTITAGGLADFDEDATVNNPSISGSGSKVRAGRNVSVRFNQ